MVADRLGGDAGFATSAASPVDGARPVPDTAIRPPTVTRRTAFRRPLGHCTKLKKSRINPLQRFEQNTL
jgi:hypothetical protein